MAGVGRGKAPCFEDTPGNRSGGGWVGPVAQRIRARGYEPWCRGSNPSEPRPFLFWKGRFGVWWRKKKEFFGIFGVVEKERMVRCDRIETKTGKGLLTLNRKSESFHFDFFDSEKISHSSPVAQR
ncbi:hypothetical protein Dimus_016496 [Dionaea muscipula]